MKNSFAPSGKDSGKAFISLHKTVEPDHICLVLIDLDNKKIERTYSFNDFIDSKHFERENNLRGFRGITWDDDSNFYFATYDKVIKTDFDLKHQEIIFNGSDIHQIDWIKTVSGVEGLGICNTNQNAVVFHLLDDISMLHIGLDGLIDDSNHICSLFYTNGHCYFVYHNHLRGGWIVRSDDQKIYTGNLFQPHNIFVSKDIMIICNSRYQSVIKITDEMAQKEEIMLNAYTRGLALSLEGQLLVGESDRNGIPKISIIDYHSFKRIDQIILPEFDDRIRGEIFDIRLLEDDLCMSKTKRRKE